MKICIDYDGTFSTMPKVFSQFIDLAQALGHECWIVTMRAPTEPISDAPAGVEVIYTNRQAKIEYARRVHNLTFDIFIDDRPICLYMDHRTVESV